MHGIEYLFFAILSILTGLLFLYLPVDSAQRAAKPNAALAQFKQYRRLLVVVCFAWAALMIALWTGFI